MVKQFPLVLIDEYEDELNNDDEEEDNEEGSASDGWLSEEPFTN